MKRIVSVFAAFVLVSIVPVVYALNDSQLEKNKQTVVAFYNEVINNKDFKAAEKYLGDHYTQHNPQAVDGPEGLRMFIDFLRKEAPNAHSAIDKIFADGDYIILHVHSLREPNTRGRAIFDLFKLENGKIVEHWDTIQDIPEKSANSNGMF